MKKIITLFLALFMVYSVTALFAGCEQKKSSSPKANRQQEKSSSSDEDSTYQSMIKLYISNSDPVLENMIPTYIDIIKSGDVIKNVKAICPDAEFTIDAEKLDGSEIIQVTVSSKTIEDLQAVKDHVADAICRQIPSIIEGATCKIVDYGTIPTGDEESKQDQSDFINKAAYKCTVKFYVNQSTVLAGDASPDISTSDITASQSIIDTYITIIQTDTVMNEVKENCCITLNTAGACYSDIDQLEEFAIQVKQIEDTQIIAVTVYAEKEAFTMTVAEIIAAVVPETIQNIVEGASCKVVDSGIPEENK